jgi:hypothetical protein
MREERRKVHNLVWVQRDKECLSLLTTPENTDSDNDSENNGGVVWSELEEGSEDEVLLAAWAKGKDVVQARAAAASTEGVASAGEGTVTVGVPGPRKKTNVRCRPNSKQHRSGLCFAQFHSVEFLMFPFHFLPVALVIPLRLSWRQPRRCGRGRATQSALRDIARQGHRSR